VSEACDGVLPANDDLEQVQVLLREEVEAAVGASCVVDLLAPVSHGVEGDGGVVEARQEVEGTAWAATASCRRSWRLEMLFFEAASLCEVITAERRPARLMVVARL